MNLASLLGSILDFVPLLGVAIALAGVFWQIHRFALERRRKDLADLRSCVNQLTVRLMHLNSIIDEREFLFLELDVAATDGLIKGLDSVTNTADLCRMLSDNRYHNSVISEMSNSIDQAEIKKIWACQIAALGEIPFGLQNSMPTTTQIISSCLFIVTRASYFMTNPRAFLPSIVGTEDIESYSFDSGPLCPSDDKVALVEARMEILRVLRNNRIVTRTSNLPLYRASRYTMLQISNFIMNLGDIQLNKYVEFDQTEYVRIQEHDDPVEQILDNFTHLNEVISRIDADRAHQIRASIRDLWAAWSSKVLDAEYSRDFILKVKGKYRLIDEA